MEDEKVWAQITKRDIDRATADNTEVKSRKPVEAAAESVEEEPVEEKPKKSALVKKKVAAAKKSH